MAQGSDGAEFVAESIYGASSRAEGVNLSAIFELLGVDFSTHHPQYKKIFSLAEREGISLDLVSWECGVFQFRKGQQIVLRLNLGVENLKPGKWESKVATVLAQLQISFLMQKYRAVLAEATELSSANTAADNSEDRRRFLSSIAELLDLEKTAFTVHINRFPGAEQLQILVADRQVASLIQNPALGIVLEFRLNFLPSAEQTNDTNIQDKFLPELNAKQLQQLAEKNREEFDVLGVIPETILQVRREIAENSCPLEEGVLALAEDLDIRVLGIGDTEVGFGDPHRRFALRYLHQLRKSGFTHLGIPAPSKEATRIQLSLKDGTFRRTWLEIASRCSSSRMSAEWTLLIQRAYEVGINIVPVGDRNSETSAVSAKLVSDVIANKNSRMLLWRENFELARGADLRGNATIGGELSARMGTTAFCSIATLSQQMQGITLRYFTETTEPNCGLKRSSLLKVADAKKISSLPFSINNRKRYCNWNYLALFGDRPIESKFFS